MIIMSRLGLARMDVSPTKKREVQLSKKQKKFVFQNRTANFRSLVLCRNQFVREFKVWDFWMVWVGLYFDFG